MGAFGVRVTSQLFKSSLSTNPLRMNTSAAIRYSLDRAESSAIRKLGTADCLAATYDRLDSRPRIEAGILSDSHAIAEE